MRRPSLSAVLFIATAGAVAFGYYMLATTGSPAPRPSEERWLYAVSVDDIEHVTINFQGTHRSFVLRPKGWFFEDPPDIPVNNARWSAVPLLLSGTIVARRFKRTNDAPAYGLDRPEMIVDLVMRGDRRLKITVGDATPDGANYYVAVERLPWISLVNAAWRQTLSRLVTNPPFPAR